MKPMTRVKICGMTRAEDVKLAAEAGADAVGFIVGFPSSPRNLSLEAVGRLIRGVPPLVESVLVTNAETLERDPDGVRAAAPGAIQLYGGARVGRLGIRAKLIRVVRVGAPGIEDVPVDGCDAVLADTYRPGHEGGGTGETSDWERCAELRERLSPLPLILSGGLTPSNVAAAIRAVKPYAVDSSSGVESSPGIKDPRKVGEFVREATR